MAKGWLSLTISFVVGELNLVFKRGVVTVSYLVVISTIGSVIGIPNIEMAIG